MCNVQHFGNIVVTLLPNMFEAVHHYHDAANVHTEQYEDDTKVEPLSIVYEVMRKWDKAFTVYKLLGAENIDK